MTEKPETPAEGRSRVLGGRCPTCEIDSLFPARLEGVKIEGVIRCAKCDRSYDSDTGATLSWAAINAKFIAARELVTARGRQKGE